MIFSPASKHQRTPRLYQKSGCPLMARPAARAAGKCALVLWVNLLCQQDSLGYFFHRAAIIHRQALYFAEGFCFA